MAETDTKLNIASQVCQIVGLVPSCICCYLAFHPPPTPAQPLANSSGATVIVTTEPRGLLLSFGAALALFIAAGVISLVSFFRRRGHATESGIARSPEQVEGDAQSEMRRLDTERLAKRGAESYKLFTELQIEALSIAKDLELFVSSFEPEPILSNPKTKDEILDFAFGARHTWFVKLCSHYRDDFGPRIRQLLLRMGKEGSTDSLLEQYTDGIKKSEDILTIRARLWFLAVSWSGISPEAFYEGRI